MNKISVNIKELVSSKNPKLAKRIPGFIYRYLNKVLHIDEINYMLNSIDKEDIGFISGCFDIMGTKYKAETNSSIKKNERYIFAANHPLGGLDGMVLLKSVNETYGDAKFIVNDFLLNIPQLRNVFIGVNKHGRQSGETFKEIENLYNSNDNICYFPAGLCSRKSKGQIRDLEWKKSFIQKARKHKRDIVPVFIEGRNSNKFYNISSIRTKLGIKANIEMLYLIDEMFKQKKSEIKIFYGEPISYENFNNPKEDMKWVSKIKETVYNLNPNKKSSFKI